MRAGCAGKGEVVRGQGERLANGFAVKQGGREVDGIQRSKNGRKGLCRALEDLPARIDERQAVEQGEKGPSAKSDLPVAQALLQSQAVDRAKAFDFCEAARDAPADLSPASQTSRLSQSDPQKHG